MFGGIVVAAATASPKNEKVNYNSGLWLGIFALATGLATGQITKWLKIKGNPV